MGECSAEDRPKQGREGGKEEMRKGGRKGTYLGATKGQAMQPREDARPPAK